MILLWSMIIAYHADDLLTWTTLPMAWNAGMLLSSANWMNLEHQVDFREGCCHHHQCHYGHQPLPTGWTCHINWISEQDSQDTVIMISSSAGINLVPQNTLVGFHFHHQQHHPITIIIMTSPCNSISGSIATLTSILSYRAGVYWIYILSIYPGCLKGNFQYTPTLEKRMAKHCLE